MEGQVDRYQVTMETLVSYDTDSRRQLQKVHLTESAKNKDLFKNLCLKPTGVLHRRPNSNHNPTYETPDSGDIGKSLSEIQIHLKSPRN